MGEAARVGTLSRASAARSEVSDGVERPYSEISGRPLSRDIEHIKALISRSLAGEKRKVDTSSITAQVFRRRGSAVDIVSKDRLYHELDLLKKRIRSDQEEEARKAQEDGNHNRTGLTTPEVTFERDRDFLKLGDDLKFIHTQRENWLEQVESRIESLGSEKNTPSRSLRHSHDELEQIRLDKESAESALREAEVKTTVLDSQLKDIRTHLDMARVELETVRTERRDAQAKYEWAMAEKNELSSKFESAQGGLQDLKKQLATTDQERRHTATTSQEAQQRILDLERRVGDAETAAYQGNRLNESRQREQLSKIQEYEVKLEQATRDLQSHERKCQQAVQDREQALQQVEEAVREKQQHKTRLDLLLAERSSNGRDLNDAENWKYSQLRQLDQLRIENDQSTNRLRKELAESKSQSRSRLADVAGQLAAKSKELQAVRQQLAQREAAQNSAEKRLKELDVLIQLKDSEAERLREENQDVSKKSDSAVQNSHSIHTEELSKIKQTHEERIQQLKDSYTQKRERMLAGHRAALDQTAKDYETRHETTVNELSGRHTAELETIHAKFKADISEMEQRHQKASNDAQALHAADLETIIADHKSVASALKSDSSRYRRMCQELEDYAAVELANMQTTHDEKLRAIQQEHSNKLTNMTNSHQTTLDQMRQDHQKQLQERDEAVDARLASLNAEGDDQAAGVKAAYDAELAQARAEVEVIRTKMNELCKTHEADTEQSRIRHAQDISEANSTHQQELSRVQEDHASERKRLQEAHTLVLTQEISEHDDSYKVLLDQMAVAEAEHQTTLLRKEAEHQSAVEQLRAEAQALRDDIKVAKNASVDQQQTVAHDHARALADLAAQHKLAIEELSAQNRELETNLEKTTANHLQRSEEMSTAHQQALASVQKQHETARQPLVEKIDLLERDMLNFQNFTGTDDESEASLETLRAELSATREQHGLAVQEIVTAKDTVFQEQIAQIQELSLKALEEEKSKHKQQIRRMKDDSDEELRSLQVRFQDISDQMRDLMQKRDSMQAEVADLRGRLDAELSAHAEAERSLAVMRKQRAEEEQKQAEARELLLQKQVAELRKEKENLNQQHRHSISSLLDLKPRSPRLNGFKMAPTITEERSDDAVVQAMQVQLLKQELQVAQTTIQQHEREQDEVERQNEFLVKEVEILMARVNSRNTTPSQSKEVSPLDEVVTKESPVSPIDHQAVSSNSRLVVGSEALPTKEAVQLQTPTPPAKLQPSRIVDDGVVTNALSPSQQDDHTDLERAKDRLRKRLQSQIDMLLAQKNRRERDVTTKANVEFSRLRNKLVARIEQESSTPDRDVRRAEARLDEDIQHLVSKKKTQIEAKYTSDLQKVTRAYERHLAELVESSKERGEESTARSDDYEQGPEPSDYTASPMFDDRSRTFESPISQARFSHDSEPYIRDADEDPQWPLPRGFATPSPQMGHTPSSQHRSGKSIPRAMPYPYNRMSYAKSPRDPVSVEVATTDIPPRHDVHTRPRPSTAGQSRSRHEPQDSSADSEVFERQPRSHFRPLPPMAMRDPYRVSPQRNGVAANPDVSHAVFSAQVATRRPEVRQPTVSANARGRFVPAEPPRPVRTSEPRAKSTVRNGYGRDQTPRSTSITPSQRMVEARSGKSFTHSSASLFT